MNVLKPHRLLPAALLLLAAAAAPLAAQTAAKPIAVISISGIGEITSDISFIAQLANIPGSQQAVAIAQPFTQGMDPKRPWGAALLTDGTQMQTLGFVPVTDIKQVFNTIGSVLGQPTQSGEIYTLNVGIMPVSIKESNGWAFVAQSADDLKKIPEDPQKLLEGLNTQYDVAVRVYMQNVPDNIRSQGIDTITAQMRQAAAAREPGEDDASYESRRRLLEGQINQFNNVFKELDSLTFGFGIDQKTRTANFDVAATAIPGSKIAKQLYAPESNTAFGGFISPTAAVRLNVTNESTADPDDIAQAVASIDSLKSRVQREIERDDNVPAGAKTAVAEVINDLSQVVIGTLKAGKIDAGASLSLDGKVNLIAGALVVDAMPVESALKKLDNLAKNEPNYPGIKFDADKQGAVRFHTMALPVPPSNEATMMFGSQLDVALGIGPKALYLAVGPGSLAKCKSAIEQSTSGKKVAALQMSVSMGQVLQFASQFPGSPPQLKVAAADLAKSGGKDQAILMLKQISNGVVYHFEAQEGVLKLLGLGQGAGGPGAAPAAFGN